jgi:CheY-like chemotaxis protein
MSTAAENSKGRIVVADDELHIRAVLSAKLRSAGYEVVEARDGGEAWELATGPVRPVMVVTDLQMPTMGGVELCTRLKADPRTAATPALLITARGYILKDEQLAATNIRGVLSKPFSAREVLRQVEAILAGASAEAGRGGRLAA